MKDKMKLNEQQPKKKHKRTDLTIWNCPNWSQYRAMLFDVFDLNVKKRFDLKCLEVENVSKCLKWCFVYFFVRSLLSFWISRKRKRRRISLSRYFASFERKKCLLIAWKATNSMNLSPGLFIVQPYKYAHTKILFRWPK